MHNPILCIGNRVPRPYCGSPMSWHSKGYGHCQFLPNWTQVYEEGPIAGSHYIHPVTSSVLSLLSQLLKPET